jgi:hypothetical protein
MSADPDERPAKAVAQEMDDEAGRMEARIDELGDHVEEAKKKAAEARPREGLAGDEALDAVAGDDADERTTSSDDPTSAVGDPERADDAEDAED